MKEDGEGEISGERKGARNSRGFGGLRLEKPPRFTFSAYR